MNDHDHEELEGYRALVGWLRGDKNRTLTASGAGLCASQLDPGQSARGRHIYSDTPRALALEVCKDLLASGVPVSVDLRHDGKWVAWESEYPDEGYVGEWDHRPTADELRAISSAYVEKQVEL